MLLLDVEAEIAADHEDDFNEWYHPHVPHLMTAPGYESGRRYLRTSGPGSKYIALYELSGEDTLPSLIGEDLEQRHPASVNDWGAWDELLVPHMTHSSINVYSPAPGTSGLLHGNHPVALVRIQAGEASRWQDLAETLGSVPNVLTTAHLQLSDHPSIQWLSGHPGQLLLLELAGLDGADAAPHLTSVLSEAPEHSVTTYRQIAWHAPFVRR